MSARFHLDGSDQRARAGALETAHGTVQTPVFMPVGTRGSVKGVMPRDLAAAGASMVLGNTYHLMLRPGCETVAAAGGLHEFVRWDRPMLTDSGGFQVFSLADRASIDDGGVTFKSTYDGATLRLGPVESMAAQRALGADVVMAFDECASLPADRDTLARAVARTTRWAGICKEQQLAEHQTLFGIVQGGDDASLREESAQGITALDLPGYAIGGLSVGEDQETFERVCRETVVHLPWDRPRYLMGVGTPRDIVAAIAAGVDMFDCVLPTRNGRNAQAFTWGGTLRLKNQKHSGDFRPIEEGCACPACSQLFSRSYLRHLFAVGEMLGGILVSLHNLEFYLCLMRRARGAILAGSGAFDRLAEGIRANYPPRPARRSPWHPPSAQELKR